MIAAIAAYLSQPATIGDVLLVACVVWAFS